MPIQPTSGPAINVGPADFPAGTVAPSVPGGTRSRTGAVLDAIFNPLGGNLPNTQDRKFQFTDLFSFEGLFNAFKKPRQPYDPLSIPKLDVVTERQLAAAADDPARTAQLVAFRAAQGDRFLRQQELFPDRFAALGLPPGTPLATVRSLISGTPLASGPLEPVEQSSSILVSRIRQALRPPTTQERDPMPFNITPGFSAGGASMGSFGGDGSFGVFDRVLSTVGSVFGPGGAFGRRPLPMHTTTASFAPAALGGLGRAAVGGAIGALGVEALQGGGNGGAGCPTSPFTASNASGFRAQPFLAAAPNGKTTWFKPAGKPILWSGDLTACKRVSKIARRAKRTRGGALARRATARPRRRPARASSRRRATSSTRSRGRKFTAKQRAAQRRFAAAAKRGPIRKGQRL